MRLFLKMYFLNNKTFREMLLRAIGYYYRKYSGCEYNKNKIWRKSENSARWLMERRLLHTEGIQFRFFRMESTIILFIPAYFYEK